MRVEGSEFWDKSRVQGCEFRDEGPGFGARGSGLGVYGIGRLGDDSGGDTSDDSSDEGDQKLRHGLLCQYGERDEEGGGESVEYEKLDHPEQHLRPSCVGEYLDCAQAWLGNYANATERLGIREVSVRG